LCPLTHVISRVYVSQQHQRCTFFTFKICGGILPWEIEFRNSCWYGSVAICFFLPYLSIFNPPLLFPLLFDFFFFYIVITNYDITPHLWITYTPHIRCVWTHIASASTNIITLNYVILKLSTVLTCQYPCCIWCRCSYPYFLAVLSFIGLSGGGLNVTKNKRWWFEAF